MEACPKIGMINFDLKTCNSDSNDLGEKLSQFIFTNYQENPESYLREINDFLKLREDAVNASRDFMGLNIMKKYYRQLQFLSNRFPMKSGEQCESEFSWDHLFDDKEIVHSDVRFEQLCVLYNIGSMHSYLGCLDKRTNDEGIKISCTHFQYAAWSFQKIRDTYSSYDFSSDLNEDVMSFKMNLMLAQAQECVLEKSIVDNRKTSINAKISAQVIDYYKLALVNCEKQEFHSIVGTKQSKELRQYCQFKINYYSALSLYFSALSSVEAKKIGESVGYIQEAEVKVNECIKMKYLKEFQDVLKYTSEMIDAKCKALKKENDFVYNEKIVSADNLPEVKGVSLVKQLPIDFDNDPEIATPDIFNRLVPMKAHELSSLYSEEKAKLLRQINGQVDEKNSQLEQFLEALQINELHLKDFDFLKLPKELLECCASVSVKSQSIRQDLSKAMKQIVDVSVQTRSIIDEIEELFEAEDKEYRQTPDYSSDSSSDDETLSKKKPLTPRKKKLHELLDRYDTLSKNHDDANQSNTALREAINSVLSNLQILSLPLNELTEKLPKIDLISDDESKVTRDRLVTLLSKLDEMKTQRAQLLHRLQRGLQDDDITRIIASKQNEITNLSDFFREQLNKHDQLMTYLQQNLQAQDNILRALADANAAFATERQKILDATKNRNTYVDNLIVSFQSVNQIIDKASKGVQFFEKLTEPLQNLLRDVTEFCNNQKKQRQNRNQFNGIQNVSNVPGVEPASFAPMVNPYKRSEPSVPSFKPEPGSDRPRLKDFLPLMKPETWGQGAKVTRPSMPSLPNAPQMTPQANLPPPIPQNFVPPSNPQQVYQQSPANFQNIPPSRHPGQNPALNFQPQMMDQQKFEIDNQLKMQQEHARQEQLAKEREIELKRKQLEQQEMQLKYMQQQFQLQQQQMFEKQKQDQYSMDQQRQQQLYLEQQKQNQLLEHQKQQQIFEQQRQQQQQQLLEQQRQQQLLLEKQKQEQMLLEQQRQQQQILEQQRQQQHQLEQQKQQQLLLENQKQEQMLQEQQRQQQLLLEQHRQQQVMLEKQKLDVAKNVQPLGLNMPFNPQLNLVNQPHPNTYIPGQPIPNSQQQQQQQVQSVNGAQILDELKPNSVYKPGYLSQMKLPSLNQVPVVQPVQAMPTPQQFNQFNSPNSMRFISQPMTQNFQSQNFALQQNVQPIVNPQSQQMRPVAQNFQPHVQPVVQKQVKPSAVDDLFDLFNGSNSNVPEPVLQPSKIDLNLISAQRVELKQEPPKLDSPKPVEVQTEINNLEIGLNKVNLSTSNESILSNQSVNTRVSFLSNQSKTEKFLTDFQKFEYHVNSLSNKTLSLNTVLDKEWKELNDYQDKIASQMTISIPRLNPQKNRFQDLLPFDQTRVCLQNTQNDYINASHLGQMSQDFDPNQRQPNFIITQLPLLNCLIDFWNMVVQEQVEILINLCRENELNQNLYFPIDKQSPLVLGNILIQLQSFKETQNSYQRVFTIQKDGLSRTVVMLQCKNDQKTTPVISSVTGIAQNEMPENIGLFIKFVKECEYFYLKEQRNRKHSILVHCMNGVSRSAVFVHIYSMIQIIDTLSEYDYTQVQINSELMLKLVKQMRSKRKYMIQSMYHLKYSYDAILYYFKDLLVKEGILVSNEINYEQPVVHESNESNGNGYLSVNEIADPNKFQLDLNEDNMKRKTSKKDFINGSVKVDLTNDPFNWLDPLKK